MQRLMVARPCPTNQCPSLIEIGLDDSLCKWLQVILMTGRESELGQYLAKAGVIRTNGHKYIENYWAERPHNIQSYTDERML